MRLTRFRDRLLKGLRARVPDLVVNGSLEARLPGNLNVSFPAIDGEALLVSLCDDIGDLVWRGVHGGRAVACAEGARTQDRSGAGVAPVRPRPLDDEEEVDSRRTGGGSRRAVARRAASTEVGPDPLTGGAGVTDS